MHKSSQSFSLHQEQLHNPHFQEQVIEEYRSTCFSAFQEHSIVALSIYLNQDSMLLVKAIGIFCASTPVSKAPGLRVH